MTPERQEQLPSILDSIIQSRCTTKALSETPWSTGEEPSFDLKPILKAADAAPFHKPIPRDSKKGDLQGHQPWRCYHLDAKQCRKLRKKILELGNTTKIPQMLAVAEYMIQTTWIPNPSDSATEQLFEPSIQNMEHIAAASSAVQNMLLAATARKIPNYWSSGGILRSEEIQNLLGIPTHEILIGSIFLFPKDLNGAVTSYGSLHHCRGSIDTWARPVVISD
ncbi:nitroreductase family protein [Pelagicoccus albus]|uniref:Nitroreductase family protein n=1 Tax=Pelagicoccus albus TaxID=415222 RepID=A0A7X1B5I9_9BACT|nr:nitroreductase family protein [Pelagicoccus albus]MBC2605912.1 nitroreductase family protein [Pelagicoccus albus]